LHGREFFWDTSYSITHTHNNKNNSQHTMLEYRTWNTQYTQEYGTFHIPPCELSQSV